MSDDERLNLRDLPPVSPLPQAPARVSQTLARHANVCKRAAYLYLVHGGGTPAHELDFGTAAHLVFERMLLDLIAQGERSLYVPQEGEDPATAQREVASLTAAIVDEVLREYPELTVPVAHKTHSADHIREQAYHWAVACDIDPGAVLAVERKFVLDLPSGVTVSGKVDVATLLDDDLAGVDDYKTGFAMEAEGDFGAGFQGKLYATLLLFGQPEDEGARLPTIGEGLGYVRVRELYPRLAPHDGELRQVTAHFSRQELADWIPDLDRLVSDLMERCETGKFPAVPGSHCSTCPAQPECPLPAVLRRHAGTINDMELAAEAASWAEIIDLDVKATRKELRRFASAHGPVRYGADRVLEFSTSESWSTDWPELEQAVERAVNYGEPFDLEAHRKRRTSTRFAPRTLTPAELDEEGEPVLSAAERFGEEPPY